jgi:hypothetical protein
MVLRGRIRGSGEEISMPETHLIKMRDGVAVEVREFPTLDEALEAVDLGRVGKLSRIRFFLDHNGSGVRRHATSQGGTKAQKAAAGHRGGKKSG